MAGKAVVLALAVLGAAEALQPWLFRWSGAGLASTAALAVLCVCSSRAHARGAWQRAVAVAALLAGAIGWWSLWAGWLSRPMTDPAHQRVIPLAVCTITVWLLLEAATAAIQRIRRGDADAAWAPALLPVAGLAADLWLRLGAAYPAAAAAALGLWVVQRRWPVMQRTGWLLSESRWGPAVILGIAVALRAAFTWRLMHAGLDPAVLDGPDSGYYHAAAAALATGQITLWEPSWLLYPRHNPGPALFFGALYAVVGPHLLAARIAQLILAAWSCLLVYGIGRRLFGELAGRLAMLLVAGHGYLVAYGSYLGAETPGLFLATLCIWWWLRLWQESSRVPKARRALWITGSGLAASVLALVRPEFLLLPPVVAWLGWRRTRTWKPWVLILALSVALPGLWIVRNGVVDRVWSLQAGSNLGLSTWTRLNALGVVAEPVQAPLPPDVPPGTRMMLPPVIDWAAAARQPAAVAVAGATEFAERAARLWSWKLHAFGPGLLYAVRDETFIVFVSTLLLLGLASGLWQSRRARPGWELVWALVLVKTAAHGCTLVQQWHRFTMEPFVNILEAAGLVVLGAWLASAAGLREPSRAPLEAGRHLQRESGGEPCVVSTAN